jgi:hypothetical protein
MSPSPHPKTETDPDSEMLPSYLELRTMGEGYKPADSEHNNQLYVL